MIGKVPNGKLSTCVFDTCCAMETRIRSTPMDETSAGNSALPRLRSVRNAIRSIRIAIRPVASIENPMASRNGRPLIVQ